MHKSITAKEIMEQIFSWAPDGDYTVTCDNCNVGSPDKKVKKVGVTMFPSVEVVRQAEAWGVDLLIVHEPMYYSGMDQQSDDPLEVQKREYLKKTGMTIWRYHDHPHAMKQDLIAQGFFWQLALDGEIEYCDSFDLARIKPNEPITARALARLIEERLDIRHVRISGAADTPCTLISTVLGAPGPAVLKELQQPDSQIVVAGEVCEWAHAEYARDAAAMGYPKALLVLGHIGSERDGMELLAYKLREIYPELDIQYFQCSDVYTYAD